MDEPIPSAEDLAALVARLRVYLALARQRCDYDGLTGRDAAVARPYPGAMLRALSIESRCLGEILARGEYLSLCGWPAEARVILTAVRPHVIHMYHPTRYKLDRKYDAAKAQEDLAVLANLIERLAAIVSTPPAGPDDQSAYVSFADARKMTGLKDYEITRWCDSGKVRSSGHGRGRLVHAGDLARSMCD
jgi:hypothetical protein